MAVVLRCQNLADRRVSPANKRHISGRYDDSDTLFENPEVQLSHDLSQISLQLPSVTRYGIATLENKESSEAHTSFVMGGRGANKSYKMGGGARGQAAMA